MGDSVEREGQEVLVTGATGFIGRQVVEVLSRRGWRPIGVSRDPEAARTAAQREIRWIGWDGSMLEEELDRVGKCINLAGQHPFGRRWNEDYKAKMRESRIATTSRIARALASSSAVGRTLISTSGTGIYGDCGESAFDETRPRGRAWFLSDMEADWEDAAMTVERAGVRVAVMRVGISLGQDGGALAILEQGFRRGMGGHVGTGEQFVPWIHNLDCARMYAAASEDAAWRGAFNRSAPEPRTFAELCVAVGRALGRRSWFHAPAMIARLMIGEASAILLESQRALPSRALALGFSFTHTELEAAMADLYAPRADAASRSQEAA